MGENKQRNKQSMSNRALVLTGISLVIVLGLIVGSVWEHTKAATTTNETKQTTQSSQKQEQPKLTKDEQFLASADLDDWRLQLVGPDHLLKKEVNEETDLTPVGNYLIHKDILEDYEALAKAAQEANHPLVIISAYRSVAYQEQVLDAGVQQRIASGMTADEALQDAKRTMTEPGHSEHHTGLAMDVVDNDWYNSYTSEVLHSDFGKTDGGKWLAENAPKYGFIIRYPEGKTDITKIDYEPWHLRYVGKDYARYITEHHLTLEEFLDQVQAAKEKSQQK